MNTKYIAGTSLIIMAVGFIVTLLFNGDGVGITNLLRGGFEAGLVGAIADWFAVTALFRHPLGIPIPHTSLILRNKPKIINALISSLENELLNKDSISRKLSKINLLGMVSNLAMRLFSRRANRASALRIAQRALESVPLDHLASAVHTGVVGYVKRMDIKQTVEKLGETLIREGMDEKALDYVLDQAVDWAAKPETGLMLGGIAQKKLQELQLGGLMGFAVQAFAGMMNEEKMGSMLQHMLLSGLKDLSVEGSQQREKLLKELRVRIMSFSQDEQNMQRLSDWLTSKLEGQETASFIEGRLEELRSIAINALEQNIEKGSPIVLRTFRIISNQIKARPEEVEAWQQRLIAFLIRVIEENHYRIGLLVHENLNQLDDQGLVNMLEKKVGSDLQWVRVNGAVCGFLIGIVLTSISWLSY